MYNTIEIFEGKEEKDLKKILKDCLLNYYIKYKEILSNELQKNDIHRTMDSTNKDIIPNERR